MILSDDNPLPTGEDSADHCVPISCCRPARKPPSRASLSPRTILLKVYRNLLNQPNSPPWVSAPGSF